MIDILTAADMALAEIRKHDLHIDTFTITPGSEGGGKYNWDTGDLTRPCLPTIELQVFRQTAAFLSWCEHLEVERVFVSRGGHSVIFKADADRNGLCWEILTSVSRPKSGPHLPGIKPSWQRQPSGRPGNEAWITVEELRVTLVAMNPVAVAS